MKKGVIENKGILLEPNGCQYITRDMTNSDRQPYTQTPYTHSKVHDQVLEPDVGLGACVATVFEPS